MHVLYRTMPYPTSSSADVRTVAQAECRRVLKSLLAHRQELLLTVFAQRVGIELGELTQRLGHDLADEIDGLVGRTVGTAHRLGDHFIDPFELLEVRPR